MVDDLLIDHGPGLDDIVDEIAVELPVAADFAHGFERADRHDRVTPSFALFDGGEVGV